MQNRSTAYRMVKRLSRRQFAPRRAPRGLKGDWGMVVGGSSQVARWQPLPPSLTTQSYQNPHPWHTNDFRLTPPHGDRQSHFPCRNKVGCFWKCLQYFYKHAPFPYSRKIVVFVSFVLLRSLFSLVLQLQVV